MVIMVLWMSASVFWTSQSIFSDREELFTRESSHKTYHHFLISFNKSQEELYKYEAGYSSGTDTFNQSLRASEEFLLRVLNEEDLSLFKDQLNKLEGSFAEYKRNVNEVFILDDEIAKKEKIKNISALDDRVNKIIRELESLSNEITSDHHADDIYRMKITKTIILVSIIVIIISTFLIVFYLRSTIIGPFQKFITSVDEVAKRGDLSLRMDVPNDDDLAILSQRFNDMMDNLEKWDHELKRNYVELQKANEELRNSYNNLEDVTAELEEKSQELSEANEELKSIDRLKNEFMQTVSHELRTPLTPIMGYLELFLNKDLGKVSSTQLEIMNDMYHCSRRLGFVIDSLLEMLSLQEEQHTEKFELIEPDSIVRELESAFMEDAKDSGLKCTVECQENMGNISGARKKLLLMVHHLLTNAVKFTPEGGEVTFTTRQNGKNVEFVIRDNGIGINDEKLKRIFEPFLQVDSSMTRGYEGIGLGLALVKRIVEMHMGKIQIESREGAGAIFTVSIPVA